VTARAAAGLSVAVLAVSWGAPLARLTDAAPLAVAMWRMVLATVLLAPVGLAGAGGLPSRQGRGGAALASVFLGLHFGLWIPSLWLTSVAASVVLVSTAPLFVLVLSPRFLGVPIRGRNLASFALALGGVAVISWGDFNLSSRALVGDLMALAAAACMAGYLVAGKRVRMKVRLATYLTAVYGGAALVLVGAVAVLGVDPLPRTAVAWLPLLAMALGPTLTGHTLLNWALAHVEAYKVNLTVLLEPVLSALWAWLVLAEAPPLHVLPGAGLVLLAVALEYLPDARQKAQAIACQ
jgi:drug/metabolite transporter (DMT)-like permease